MGSSLWQVVEVDPKEAIPGLNIRPLSPGHVQNLAVSMASIGQLQECVGDIDPSSRRVRIFAGLHRLAAAQRICQFGGQFRLRVRVSLQELTAEQILEIQIAENLHENLTPAQEAEAIECVWLTYLHLYGKEASVSKLAQAIGRSEDKVRDALKFVSLEPLVRGMVETGALHYSYAIEIARLPMEKQLPIAVRIITGDLSREASASLIRRTAGEDNDSLFDSLTLQQIERDAAQISFKTAADRHAKAAAGYFQRISRLLDILLEEYGQVTLSPAVIDILGHLIEAALYFRDLLAETSNPVAAELEERVKSPAE